MKKEINVKIEGKEWTEALDKAFKKANAKLKLMDFVQDMLQKKYS